MEKLQCASARKLAGWQGHRAIALAFWLSLPLPMLLGHAQTQSNPQGVRLAPQVRNPPGYPATDSDTPESPVDADRIRLLNTERQRSMVSDTNKLLRLVNELNAQIAGNNEDSLTPAQLRKVAEIEKLARNVKEKMSTPLVAPPVYRPPLFPGR